MDPFDRLELRFATRSHEVGDPVAVEQLLCTMAGQIGMVIETAGGQRRHQDPFARLGLYYDRECG